MPTYLYFLLWGGLFFVMMRFGCGAHVTGHGHGHRRNGDSPDSRQANTAASPPAATELNDGQHH